MAESAYVFGTDRPLLYDVDPWNKLGFAVANFGDNAGTLSFPIYQLADVIGKSQLTIMTSRDAARMQPPSRNTIERLGKVINRIKTVLSARQKADNEKRLEEGHADPSPMPWMIHPVPYFGSAVLRNPWMAEYNRLCMIALTNMYQHSDNNLALTVTEKFAADVWQYFREIQRYVAIELLLLPAETVSDPNFQFLPEHYDAYQPSLVTLNFEAMDTPGAIFSLATRDDDLRPLFEGIPSTLIAPLLKQYPVDAAGTYWSGRPLPSGATAPGTEDEGGIAPSGRPIGEPQV